MCIVNVTEFRNNIFHYIELCSKEEIQITKNGEVVAILSNPKSKSYQALFDLVGCLKESDTGEDYNDVIGEEIMKRCGY